MITAPEGRWPPVYDADDLAAVIRELVDAEQFGARFWELRSIDRAVVCQGDIVQLDSAVAVIDEDGEPVATDRCQDWMVVGNTCDFARDQKEVRWGQLVPLVDVGEEVDHQMLGVFRRYEYSRRFYVPPWPGGETTHRFADFTRPVAVHKAAFTGPAKVAARMQYAAWVLLHSCLIRFLARDDGRHDGP